MAARSVNSTVAGTRFRGLYISVSLSRRASGTFEMPTDVSPLLCVVRAVLCALVMSWKRVDLPLDPKPIRAALSMRWKSRMVTRESQATHLAPMARPQPAGASRGLDLTCHVLDGPSCRGFAGFTW